MTSSPGLKSFSFGYVYGSKESYPSQIENNTDQLAQSKGNMYSFPGNPIKSFYCIDFLFIFRKLWGKYKTPGKTDKNSSQDVHTLVGVCLSVLWRSSWHSRQHGGVWGLKDRKIRWEKIFDFEFVPPGESAPKGALLLSPTFNHDGHTRK